MVMAYMFMAYIVMARGEVVVIDAVCKPQFLALHDTGTRLYIGIADGVPGTCRCVFYPPRRELCNRP